MFIQPRLQMKSVIDNRVAILHRLNVARTGTKGMRINARTAKQFDRRASALGKYLQGRVDLSRGCDQR